jgi:hypothetical protein
MRIMLASLFVAGLAGCAEPPPKPPTPVVVAAPPRAPSLPPSTAPICGKPADKTAFAVAGLKTQLVVLAISCSSGDQYNDFVKRFRPELLAQEKTLEGFFTRAYGRRSATEQNDYITALANNTSRTGLALGTEFCQRNATRFSEVLALKTGPEMSAYAATQSFDQPLTVPDCADQAAPAAKPPVKK